MNFPPEKGILIQWALSEHQDSQFSVCILEDIFKFFQQTETSGKSFFSFLFLGVKILTLLYVVLTQNKICLVNGKQLP